MRVSIRVSLDEPSIYDPDIIAWYALDSYSLAIAKEKQNHGTFKNKTGGFKERNTSKPFYRKERW